MTQEVEDVLAAAETECSNAVAYVGRANYAEREREAERWVERAFERLRAAIANSPGKVEAVPKPKTAAVYVESVTFLTMGAD